MDRPENKTLFKGIQNHVRTIVHHVSCNIAKCTYVKLTNEQQGSINAQLYSTYLIMQRYRNNWAVKELTIRALTHQHNHLVQIKKASGHVAWCNKLKAQRKARKAGNTSATTRKGKGKASDDNDPTPVANPRPRPRPRPTRVEDSKEEASDKDPLPAPGPLSSGQTTKDKSSKCTANASTEETNEDKPTPVPKPLRVKRKAEDAPVVSNDTPKKAQAQPVESSKDKNMNDPKPSLSKSKDKGVATPAEVTSDNGEPAPALERPMSKQKTKESQKNKVQEQVIEDDSKPNTISQLAKEKHKGTKEIYPPVSSTVASSTPPCPAEPEEPASAEAGLEEATQEHPPTVAPSTSAPAVAPRLGSDALEAGTREDESDKDILVPKPAQKRVQPSPLPATSPPPITNDELVDTGKKRKTPPTKEPTAANGKSKGAKTRKALPAKKGRKTATLVVANDEMVRPSAAAESQAAPKGEWGQQAKQELINATDGLLGDTPPAPAKKKHQYTKANKH